MTSHSDKRGKRTLTPESLLKLRQLFFEQAEKDFEAWWDAEHSDNFIMPTKAIREWAGKAWVAAARKYLSARTETLTTKGNTAMFHESEGLFFERQPDGSVRVIKTYDKREPRPDNVVLDHIIKPGPWASVIATMSKQGEFPNGGWDRAVKFHNE